MGLVAGIGLIGIVSNVSGRRLANNWKSQGWYPLLFLLPPAAGGETLCLCWWHKRTEPVSGIKQWRDGEYCLHI